MEKPKAIDAVKMVRRIRDAHYEELKGATREERIAFFNEKVRLKKDAPAEVMPEHAREPGG
jgi:hypothetical protein